MSHQGISRWQLSPAHSDVCDYKQRENYFEVTTLALVKFSAR
jgi:hypothetical protein